MIGRTLLLLFAIFVVAGASAQDVQYRAVGPAELRKQLATGEYAPMLRRELERLSQAALRAGDPHHTAALSRVTYSAVLDGDMMRGTLQARIQKASHRSLSLVHLGKAVPEDLKLRCNGQPMRWGIGPSGRVAAALGKRDMVTGDAVSSDEKTDAQASDIAGTWTAIGSERPWGREYRVPLLATASAEFRLRLAADEVVTSDTGFVIAPKDEAGEWKIVIGGESALTLRVHRRPAGQSRSAILSLTVNAAWSISGNTIDLQSTYAPTVTGGDMRSLRFTLPPAAIIDSVVYGSDISLPVRAKRTNLAVELLVALPRPLRGKGRSIVVKARFPRADSGDWELPKLARVTAIDSQSRAMRLRVASEIHRLRVEPPLQVQRLKLDGVRQTASNYSTDGSQLITLQRFEPGGAAIIAVAPPLPTLALRGIEHVIEEPQGWRVEALLVNTAVLPETVVFKIPTGLTVLTAVAGTGAYPCEIEQSGGRLALRVPRFAQSARVLRISARVQDRAVLPLFRPQQSRLMDSFAVAPRSLVDNATGLAIADLGLSEGLDLSEFDAERDSIVNLREVPRLTLASKLLPKLAEARSVIKKRREQLVERVTLEVDPGSRPISSFAVRSNNDLSRLKCEAGEVRIQERPDAPPSERVWTVSLSKPLRTKTKLALDRAVTASDVFRPTLIVAETQMASRGSVIFEGDEADMARLVGDGIEATEQTATRQVWSYAKIPESVELQLADTVEQTRVVINLESRIASTDVGEHVATMLVESNNELFRFSLDDGTAKVRAVFVDGVRVRVTSSDGIYAVPVRPNNETTEVRLLYSSVGKPISLVTAKVLIPVPQPYARVRTMMWSVTETSGRRIVDAEPFARPRKLGALRWMSRFLGPLAVVRQARPFSQMRELPFAPEELAVTLPRQVTLGALAWCSLFAAAIVTLMLARIRPARDRYVLWLLACAVAATCIVPTLVAPIAGGAVIGCSLVLALREHLLSTPSHGPQRLPSTVVQAVAGLAFILCTAGAVAQDSEPPEVVLEPRRFTAARPTDTVYPLRRLLDRLRKKAGRNPSDDYLIESAEYRARMNDGHCVIIAELRLLLTAEKSVVDLDVPFALANAAMCRVDGAATEMRKSPQPGHLRISLAGATDTETLEQRSRLVEFELHPPLAENRVTLNLPLHPAPIIDRDAPEAITVLNSRIGPDRTVRLLDGARQLVLAIGETDQPVAPAIAAECSVEIGATSTSYQHKLTVKPGDEPCETVDLLFPSTVDIEEVLSPETVFTHEVFRVGEGEQWCVVRLAAPERAEFSLTIRSSHVRGDGDSVPLFSLLARGQQPTTLSGRIGFELLGVSADPPRNVVTNDDGTFGINIAAPISVAPESRETPYRQEVVISQTVRVTESELLCDFEATVTTAGSSAFSHELQVDPRFTEVNPISVRAVGSSIDQIARWHRDGNNVTLFLENSNAGEQRMHLTARMPRAVTDKTVLPILRFAGATSVQTAINIEADANLALELDPASIAVLPSAEQEAIRQSLKASGSARFDYRETHPPVILTRLHPPAAVDSLYVVADDEDHGRVVTTHYRVTPGHNRNRTFAIRPNGGAVRGSESVQIEKTEADEVRVVLASNVESGFFQIEHRLADISASVAQPKWAVRVWEREHLLALPKQEASQQADGSIRALGVASLPKWVRARVGSNTRVFIGTPSWTPGSGSDASSASFEVRLAETELWHHDDTIVGRTTFSTTGSGGNLTVLVPSDVQLKAVSSGKLSGGTPLMKGELVIPMDSGQDRVTILWNREFRQPLYGRTLIGLPHANRKTVALVRVRELDTSVSVGFDANTLRLAGEDYRLRRQTVLAEAESDGETEPIPQGETGLHLLSPADSQLPLLSRQGAPMRVVIAMVGCVLLVVCRQLLNAPPAYKACLLFAALGVVSLLTFGTTVTTTVLFAVACAALTLMPRQAVATLPRGSSPTSGLVP